MDLKREYNNIYSLHENQIKNFFFTGVEIVGHLRLKGFQSWKVSYPEFSLFGIESLLRLSLFCFESRSVLCIFSVESHSELSPFGVESLSMLSLFYVESQSEFSPFSVISIPSLIDSEFSPFGVKSIRGWVPSGLSLFGIESIRDCVHSGLGPFGVQSLSGLSLFGYKSFSRFSRWIVLMSQYNTVR